MSAAIGPFAHADHVTPQRFAPRPADAAPPLPGHRHAGLGLGELPPRLHAEIDTAYRRTLDLATQNRELHFDRDEDSGCVVVQVRDLEGNVIRHIPLGLALDVIAGAAL